ncbi:MAG: apolipoprotein N-acyltransferase [Candidatus Omnitrophota bacterium]
MLRQESINKRWVKISLSALSGVLGFLAFPPFSLSPLAWIFLVPLLLVIKHCSSKKEGFLYGYFSGLIFFAGLLYWLPNVSVPGTIVLVLYLSVFWGVFGAITRIIFKYSADILILPFFWVVLEYIRGHLFTGFPWGLIAYSQYTNLKFIQIADLTGAHGVSFLIIVFNMAILAYITRMERKIGYLMIALFFLLIATAYGTNKLDNFKVWGSPRISVVQGNVPQNLKWDPSYARDIEAEYDILTREVSADKADLIIWPETAYPYLIEDSREAPAKLRDLALRVETPLLAGVIYSDGRDYYNSALFLSDKGGVIARYDKLHLVPFGEYVPFEKYIPFRRYIDKPIGDFKEGEIYTLFPVRSVSLMNMKGGALGRQTSFYKFGVLICFEDIFPVLARRFVLKGANFLVNMTNDAWFGRTAAPEQHLQASVFRAVENRVPVIRAANTGVSCFIDSTGEILSRVKKGDRDTFVSGYATAKVNVAATRSVYTRYGDVFVVFCGFMIVILSLTEAFLIKAKSKTR